MKNNIIIIEGQEKIGGGQIMTKKICDNLMHYNIELMLPDSKEAMDFFKDIKLVPFKIKPYNKGKKNFIDYVKFVSNLFGPLAVLINNIKKKKIEIIYIQSQNMVPVGVLAGMLTKTPVVIHLHVYHIDKKSRDLLNYFAKFNIVKKIIGVSEYTLSQLYNYNIQKSEVLYNVVEFPYTNSLVHDSVSEKDFKIAIMANIYPDKGHDILLDAISKLDEKLNVTLFIIGESIDDDYFKLLERKIENLKFNVIFTGRISEVAKIIPKMNLVIIPSIKKFETFSLSMVESWFFSVPTIASDFGGMKELVEKHLFSYREYMLFETGDSNDLSKKIKMLIDSPTLYNNIVGELKGVCEREFSNKIFKRKLSSIINSTGAVNK